MVRKLSGMTTFQVTMISAIPYLLAWPAMLLIGASSDRTRERRWHTAVPLFLAGIALLGTRINDNLVFGLTMFTLAAIGINGRLPAFWSLPTSLLAGTSGAAAIGVVNCIGNMGGFFGPYIVGKLTDLTHTYAAGVVFLIGSALLAGVCTFLVKRFGKQSS